MVSQYSAWVQSLGLRFNVVQTFHPEGKDLETVPDLIFLGVQHSHAIKFQDIAAFINPLVGTRSNDPVFVEYPSDENLISSSYPELCGINSTFNISGWEDPKSYARRKIYDSANRALTRLNDSYTSSVSDEELNSALTLLQPFHKRYLQERTGFFERLFTNAQPFPDCRQLDHSTFQASRSKLVKSLTKWQNLQSQHEYVGRQRTLCRTIRDRSKEGKGIWIAGASHFSYEACQIFNEQSYNQKCVQMFVETVKKTGRTAAVVLGLIVKSV